MHHDYAETPTKRKPGEPEDDNLRSPTLTFDPSEVSTAYEPAYEPDDYGPPPIPPPQASTNRSPLAPKGVGALLSPRSSSKHQPQHKRQQSAPIFSLPRLDNSSRPSSLSPTRRAPHPHNHHHAKQPSQGDMPLTGDGRSGIGRPPPPPQTSSSAATTPGTTASGMFANWFNGSSSSTTTAAAAAAKTLTVDERRRSTPGNTPRSSWSGGVGIGDGTLPSTPNEVTATTPKSPGGQSRLGAFASSVSAAFGTRSGATNNNLTPLEQEQLDDELCDLDIHAALYPASTASTSTTPLTPNGSDTFSPAAYKNLKTNAAGLLLRMQGAYRARTAALREARAEVDAQREETEEAHARVALFRRQLEDMAAKAAEHEAAMLRLVMELNAEKQARREERAALASQQEKNAAADEGSSSLSIHSPPSEDLLGVHDDDDAEDDNGVADEDEGEGDEDRERRRRWRGSVETMMTDVSSASTSAPESESVSVFSRRSRSRSPTVMTTITVASSTTASTMTAGGSRMSSDFTASLASPKTSASAALAPPKPKPVQQLSTFQKLVKGMSSGNEQQLGPESCRNCQGQSSSVAWDTVSLLRDENKGLKHRVAQLEVAVESALDVVSGIGM